MGRLKKDHSGYTTSGKWLKYQQPSLIEIPLKSKAKKDTKKWCRGKVGVKHDYILEEKFIGHWYSYSREKCTGCGKKKWY